MLIDRKHTGWALATAAMAAAAVAVYLWDAPRHLHGPRGSTVVGLTLGGIALAFMLFAAALGLKRRVPHWRLGRAQSWMRGHVWLGLLTCLFVALHGAFKLGGPLTTWMWIILGVVTVSGLLGLAIQQSVPSLLFHGVPGETVAQQLQRQLDALPGLAEESVKTYVGSLDTAAPAIQEGAAAAPPAGGEPLRMFYLQHARPLLAGDRRAALVNPTRSVSLFASLRTSTPPHIHPGIAALEALCDRRRQWLRQRQMTRVLLIWLIVHVPLSWALLVMTFAHAVVAIRY